MDAYLGLDIGTTAVKAGLFSLTGEQLALGRREHPLLQPAPDRAEQDPMAIETAAIAAIAEALAAAPGVTVLGMGLSTAMHGLMAVDAKGQPLTSLITWADNRAANEARELRRSRGARALYERTGTPMYAMTPLVKLRWLKHHEPAVFKAAARFVSAKEWLLSRWCGDWVVDHALAAGTGLFDLDKLCWDARALRLAGITARRLARPVPTTEVLALLPAAASLLGLPAGLRVVVGAGDGMLANLGAGAIAPHTTALTVGTSGAVRAVVPRPHLDRQMRTFCYPLAPGRYVVGGATNNGGIVLQWLRDHFCAAEVADAARTGTEAYALMEAQAAAVGPGAGGLVMLPYLAGERAPLWDADARGTLFGLGLEHGRPHLIRAGMEGVLYALVSVLRVLQALEPALAGHPLRVSGGFAKSDVWCQMLADMTGQAIEVPTSPEASALGAAALTAFALGDLPTLEAAGSWNPTARTYAPTPAAHAVYLEVAALYERLVAAVRPEFEAIAHLRERKPT